ncbi:MAG: Rne/Rng family ribonuclease [Polyangiaceae bacterium]|nr:Rne/Rng family ribonuclease [Polyangiaceae bacterium]
MGGNLLVINVDIREIRVALIESGIIAELHIERLSSRSTLGSIYLGAVSRVLPGMQAAFIDIGQERAAFLHVEDLIRPDDFEAYLQGGSREARSEEAETEGDGEREDAAGTRRAHTTRSAAARMPAIAAEDTEDAEDEDEGDGDGEPDAPAPRSDDESSDEGEDELEAGAAPGAGAAEDEEILVTEGEPIEAEADEVAVAGDDDEGAGPAETDVVDAIEGGAGDEGPTAPAARAPAGEPAGGERGPGGGRGRRGRRRSQRVTTPTREERAPVAPAAPGRAGRNDRSGRRQQKGRRGGKPEPRSRISKSTPIREVVREGQQVVVQVSKEPIGTKGARVTSHVSLPGRYVVYLPTVENVGISKRIGSDQERARLREVIESVRPPKGGLVVRTMAEGLTKKQLKNDVGYLVKLWAEIAKKRDEAPKAPCQLYQELDLVLRTARDLFTDDVEKIVIDNREQFARLRRFVEMFMPERVGDVELYEGSEPVFDAYGIEDEITRALSRKVRLASGGHLVIDQAEALTAIDVNTGRFVGKGSKDLEETILKTNLEAVEEIAYQLRFRNIGGLIILDLIDMERASNREKVRRRLEELLAKDKAKTTLNRISELGLIEMTRKRTRESLGRLMTQPCDYCDGTGQVMSKETIAYEILRQVRREQRHLKGYRITVNAHPAIIDLLKNEEREAILEAERLFARSIELVARKEYHIEQFDLQGG